MSTLYSRFAGLAKSSLFLIFLSVLLFPALPSSSNPKNQQNEIQKIEEDLSKEREQLLGFHEKEKQLLKELSRLENEIEEKKRFVVVLRKKIDSARGELDELKNGLRRLEIEQRQIKTRVENRLVAFYKNAKRGYLHLLISSTDMEQLQKRIKYLNIILQEDQRLLTQMNVLQIQETKNIVLLNNKIAAIKELERSESDRLLSLKENNDRKIMLLMKIHKEKEFYATAVNELELAAKRFKETMLDIEKKDIKTSQTTAFGSWKGKLIPPIEGGKIVEIEKSSEEGYNRVYKGVYIQGDLESEIKAVYDGNVDYSGSLRGYGQLIVINHGLRYFTVSAHLGQRLKEKGEHVRQGETIGRLENSELSTLPRLYFEIRQGAINLNPLEWLKLH